MTENIKEKEDAAKPGRTETAYPLEKLAKDCREIFGVSPSTFAGAAHGLPDGCQMTVHDMKKRIEEFQKTPVKLKKGGN